MFGRATITLDLAHILVVNKIFRVTVLLLIYRTEENVESVNDLVLRQEDKPQTDRTVHEIS